MNKNTAVKMSGIALAVAAAGLSGCAATSSSGEGVAKAAPAKAVHCYGVNACGGHNDCKTAENACAGKASCKGTGFVALNANACEDIGGTQKDEWTGTVSTADFIHCYGVNACKGHNDCKTAENACAGQSSCKGTGFVAMTAKACGDVGGRSGA